MHTLTFFPLGNADCTRIELENCRQLLFDYGNQGDPDENNDKRIDLATRLREDLQNAKRDYYDIVAFTHLDDDHICGAPDFFYLEHAKKYQDDERIKINELWVPAAVIIDDQTEGDAAVIQAEARYRFKQKKGIRVFSRPDRLKEWVEKQGLKFEEHKDLITDAGNLIPGFGKDKDGVEFFVHSPFAEHIDDKTVVDRNEAALVVQATFLVQRGETRLILGADTTHDVWTSIVKTTKAHGREQRLAWDLFKLPHHCSYLTLSAEKGKDKTKPDPDVKWLFETQGAESCTIISSSDPIPTSDTDQPPHRQAANYYKDVVAGKGGDFMVTMQHPDADAPEPIVITIEEGGQQYQPPKQTTGKTLVAAIGAARPRDQAPTQRVGFGR